VVYKDHETGREKEIARVNPGICEGCGACIPVCRPKAVDLLGFSDEQIYSEINVLSDVVEVKGKGT
jgi:heterodisulfide reductase subunit A